MDRCCDAAGDVTSAGVNECLYDGDGNRVAKTAGSVTTLYLIDDVNPTGLPQVMEELVNGAVQREYTYGLDRISENQLAGGVWTASFYGVDGMDSVRQLTNSAGAVTDTYEYDAFGNMVNKTGPAPSTYTPNNYLYRGEQWDPDLGLYYLRARYYNPVTGRFLNVDPLAGQGQRRYEYADADPVDGSDPSGMAFLADFALQLFAPPGIPWHPSLSGNVPSLPWPGPPPPWCQATATGSVGSLLPPCKKPPCSEKPGLSAGDARYLCLYYQPMVAKASAYGVNPALPLGLGVESTFATSSRYYRTGDAFGMSGGHNKDIMHFSSPEQNIDTLFSSGTACGTPSYGERMRGTESNIELFLRRLELQDAKGNPLTGPKDKNGNAQNLRCKYNSQDLPPTAWKAMIRKGISDMQTDIPIFLSSQ